MRSLRILVPLAAVATLAAVLWAYRRQASIPEVRFAPAASERLVSTLVTNAKVEPSQWWPVRAGRAGVIEKVAVQRGQRVARGALIAALDTASARAAVTASSAAVTQAKAQLATVQQGGADAARVEIDNALARTGLDLTNARADMEALERLEKKEAATRQQVAEARQRVEQLQAEMDALQRKRGALVGRSDLEAARARLEQVEAELEQARIALAAGRITSPFAGIVFDLPARPGAFVNSGDLVASVGNLDRLLVRVYVDEPELGRVREGMPVTITWDALPGREWKGAVDSLPTQVVALGTRQVGEVMVSIGNPEVTLLPGTNVNAEIQTEVVESALTVPKEAIRRDETNEPGVFVLRGDRIRWVPVKLGPSSVTRTAVQGLARGDMVALSTESVLLDGQRVKPVTR